MLNINRGGKWRDIVVGQGVPSVKGRQGRGNGNTKANEARVQHQEGKLK